MKMPIPIMVAAAVLALQGFYMVDKQTLHDYPSGAIGNLATLGCMFIFIAGMLMWKPKGWRWVGVALYVILIFGDIALLKSIPEVSSDFLPVIAGSILFLLLHIWLAYVLAMGASTIKYLSERPKPNPSHADR
jgi:hypothetical protein